MEKTYKFLKIILITIFFAGILGSGYYYLFRNEDRSGNTIADNLFGWKYPVTKFPLVGPTSNQIAYSDIRDPGGIPEGLPVRLKIPIIKVDSAIEDALITPDGRMDVPSGSVNVAWFALGPHPGDVGSAVIGGHFGIRNGVKFVFYDLDKLALGDKIYIENDKGDTLVFKVRLIKLFDRNADATTVFTSSDGLAHLNLITCEGIWNQTNGTYPERRVVFTDALGVMGGISTGVTSTTIPPHQKTLRVGSRGADVVTLQNALIQKGFLRGVVDGIFGRITYTAVVKYQTSVGLKPDGVFGSLSRTKLITGLEKSANLPNTASSPSIENVSSGTLTQSVKTLYATPIDGVVTTVLLLSILFIIFKIIRRNRI